MSQFTRFGIGMVAGAAIMLAGSTAFAQLDKCQAGLEKNGLKLTVAAVKALNKCKDSIRKQQVKGKPLHAAAQACEKTLAAVLGIPGGVPAAPLANKTKIGKFIAAVNKLSDGNVCTATELFRLGHMITGANAPGISRATDWTAYWLVWAKLKLAWLEEIFEVGDTVQVLNAAITASPDNVKPCDNTTGKNCGTSCTATTTTHVLRPNLCAFRQLTFPQCRLHSCNLAAGSGATINPLSLPVGLSDRKLTLQLCKPVDTVPGLTVPAGFRTIIGDPGRGFQPPPVVPIMGGIRVCIDQIRSQGWCDCVGAGVPFEPTICQDHVQNNNAGTDDCGAPLNNAGESNCVCGFPPAATCNTGCVVCVDSTDGSRCHPGTINGTAVGSSGGASAIGDCAVLNTIALKLVPQGICLDAMLNPIGQCTVPGPGPDAGCVMLGGVACADADGPDGVTCTADDLIPPANPTTIPFTTGTSTSSIQNAVATEGACSGSGMNCATDDDCAVGSNGICTGVGLTNLTFSAGPGAGVSCASLEASQLAGWSIAGSFPALDGSGGLNDTVTTFILTCE